MTSATAVVLAVLQCPSRLLSTHECTGGWFDADDYYAPTVAGIAVADWKQHRRAVLKDSRIVKVDGDARKGEFGGGRWFYSGDAPLDIEYKPIIPSTPDNSSISAPTRPRAALPEPTTRAAAAHRRRHSKGSRIFFHFLAATGGHIQNRRYLAHRFALWR